MNGSVFTPNIQSAKQETSQETQGPAEKPDAVAGWLLKIAQYAVLAIFGLSIIFFIPGVGASLGFAKVLFTVSLAGLAVLSLSLLTLRKRSVRTLLPMPLAIFWAVVLTAVLSALLSGDVQDALVGSVFGSQTAGFLALLAALMSVALVLQGSKLMTIKAVAVFGCVSGILLIYSLARIFFGAGFLPLGSFADVTSSPIGGFNDLALFAGLIVILGLITLLQLPLRGLTQAAVGLLVCLGLLVLAVVNFFTIWVVVGFFGLLLLVYILSRDTLFTTDLAEEQKQPISKMLLLTTAIVCVVSVVFIVGGEYAGNKIKDWSGIDYIEVKPSAQATLDVARAVYSQDVLFGIGPNRFADAWRLHKNPAINETIFWETNFQAGSGYIPTLFVTLGVAGAGLLVLFHGYFLLLGYRLFLRNGIQDSYWYYFGVLSFTAAVFLWGMSYVYVPGVSILLLAALFTGFTFVASAASANAKPKNILLANSRPRGFFLMATTIIIITATVAGLLKVGEQYVAQAGFAHAQATATATQTLDQAALTAYQLFADDQFVSTRARIRLADLNTLAAIAEPTEADQQQFVTAAEQAVTFAQAAIQNDPSNPNNYAVLAGVYSALAGAGFEEAAARADAALETAQERDPHNPTYDLLTAQVAIKTGQEEKAREAIASALEKKRNYTQALYLSAQLDIAEGNVEAAITTTQNIIALEPNNPTRYFQLGLLLSSNDDTPGAIAALQAAIARDTQYANARYFLALAYISNEQPNLALEQLEIVQETNAENEELAVLIEQLKSGEVVALPEAGQNAPVADPAITAGENTTISSGEDLDTDLVTPVNTVPGGAETETNPETEPTVDPESEPAAASESATTTETP